MQLTSTINLPIVTINHLQQIAEREHRTLADTVDNIVRERELLPRLPDAIEAELASYEHLSNESLKLLATPALPAQEAAELKMLNHKASSSSLTVTEEVEADRLTEQFELGLLRRSTVLEILHRRGVDVSAFLQSPTV